MTVGDGEADSRLVRSAFVLCQWDNSFPGPVAWLCRMAWTAGVSGGGFDAEAVAAEWWKGADPDRDRVVSLMVFVAAMGQTYADWWRIPGDACFDCSGWFAG